MKEGDASAESWPSYDEISIPFKIWTSDISSYPTYIAHIHLAAFFWTFPTLPGHLTDEESRLVSTSQDGDN